MPNKKFLEEYPLYKKYKNKSLPKDLREFQTVSIKMSCLICKSDQTFKMDNDYYELGEGFLGQETPAAGRCLDLIYRCSGCDNQSRYFFIKVSDDREDSWLMKIGQFPAWEIKAEPNIERLLGKYAHYYKKGLICESQSYGIGAFSYYRRIVEETIDELLNEISELMSGEELEKYKVALAETKKTTVTSDKIDLVKDLLPSILRPNNMNPLSLLHSILSEGLHAASDEACLERASNCRNIIVFLVSQVASSRDATKTFTSSMHKLLEKKSASKH